MDDLFVLFAGALLSGLIGLLIGKQKGRPTAGFFWGFFLSILGWLVILVGPNYRPKCEHCKGIVEDGATRCKHCGESLETAAT